MFFDTHAHLEDEQIQPVFDDVIAAARDANMAGITAIGTTVETSRACLDIARSHDFVYASVGIHPNHCSETNDQDWQAILELADDPNVVAIGETGLDRYWDYCPIETQRQWFAKHIELSFELQKPLVIHMRECESDILEMLDTHQRDGHIIGIMHSFAGSMETAQRCLELGMFISFAGMVTFKKSVELREIASQIPLDRILVETDSPYLTPHPHRGKRPNMPVMVRYTAECVAEQHGLTPIEFAEISNRNAKTVFRISD